VLLALESGPARPPDRGSGSDRSRSPWRAILEDYRRWLGLAPARVIHAPMTLVRFACAVGDRIGGPLNTTAFWRQLEHGNTGRVKPSRARPALSRANGRPRVAAEPAHVQDRWHARIYFVRAHPALHPRFPLV
jgi:hypothetical protein